MAPVDECRFGFLLNPIKDLTKNWEIDLSKFLEEYLCQLSGAPVPIDGCDTVMNFAEAAMLIQGTAGVYSRKVEFLWTLVVQMLDMLANKKSGVQSSAKSKDGATGDDANTSMGFVPVNDFPLCKKRFCEENVAGETVKFLPLTPTSLVDKDKTHRSVPLLSLNDDLLGNKDDYRLNFTLCSTTGRLCTESDIENMLRSAAAASSSEHVGAGFLTHVTTAEVCVFETSVLNGAQAECAVTNGPAGADVTQANDNNNNNDDIASDDGGGGDGDGGGDSPSSSSSPSSPARNMGPTDDDHDQLAAAAAAGDNCTVEPSGYRRNRQRHLPLTLATIGRVNGAWQPVDIYDDSCSLRARPVRHGRITRPPPCLTCHQQQTRPAVKRKRKCVAETAAADATAAVTSSEQDGDKPTKQQLSDYLREHVFLPVLSAPPAAAAAGGGSSSSWSRRQLARVNELMHAETLANWAQCKQQLKTELKALPDDDGTGDKDDDDDSGGDDDGGDESGDETDRAPLVPAAAAALAPPRLTAAVARSRDCDSVLQGGGGGGGDTYEELVQRRVADYLNAAQQYVQSTELSRRVARWQEQVRPRLEREAARCQFDIHEYGSQLLRRFPSGDSGLDTSDSTAAAAAGGGAAGGAAKTTLLFSDTMAGEDTAEIARYLLSTLMLANTYNVEISLNAGGGGAPPAVPPVPSAGDGRSPHPPPLPVECQPMDCVELTLLSRRRHHDVFHRRRSATAAASASHDSAAPVASGVFSGSGGSSDLPPEDNTATATAKLIGRQSKPRGAGRGRPSSKMSATASASATGDPVTDKVNGTSRTSLTANGRRSSRR